jgi:hypothetical protein
MPKKTLNVRMSEADALDNRWLADGNEAAEKGNTKRAEYCYAKGQFWLDRYNLLTGNSDRPAPSK